MILKEKTKHLLSNSEIIPCIVLAKEGRQRQHLCRGKCIVEWLGGWQGGELRGERRKKTIPETLTELPFDATAAAGLVDFADLPCCGCRSRVGLPREANVGQVLALKGHVGYYLPAVPDPPFIAADGGAELLVRTESSFANYLVEVLDAGAGFIDDSPLKSPL